MEYILKNSNEKSFLYSKNNIVTEIDDYFTNITGYSSNELIGKSLIEISCMLKIDSQIYLENIEDKYSCFMFTKKYEPIEVIIYCKRLKCNNEKIYFIRENKNSSVKERFDFVNQLYANSKVGFSIISVPHLILLKSNDNYLNYLREPYNKIHNSIGKKIKDIIPTYNLSIIEELLKSVVTTGKPYHIEEFKDDFYERETTYWNGSIVPIFVEGKLKYIIIKMVDVTGEVLNKNILDEKIKVIEEQKNKLEIILENMSDKVIIFDKDKNITRINKLARNDIWGYENSNDYFKAGKLLDIDGNLILEENCAFSRIIKGEILVREKVIIKTNNKSTYAELSGNPIYDNKGNFIAGVILIQDITDRLKSENTLLLETQYNTLNTIIRNLDLECAIVSYPDLNINYINNKSYTRLKKNYPQIEVSAVLNQNVFDIFKYDMCEKDKAQTKIRNLIEKKSNSCFYYKKNIAEGEEKFSKVMCQPILGLNNEVVEVIFISIDVTEEIKARNKMEETLKMQEEIFANISHELKTPLNVIFSSNQLMQLYLKNDSLQANNEKISNGINIIKQNCYRFTKLINNVIDVSKIDSGFLKLNLSNENIVNIIEEIVQSICDYIKVKGLNIIFDTNVEEKIIVCDPDKIERIILNLISNAFKFTNPGGSIFVNLIDKGEIVEICVQDTGIGMDEQHLDNIFKRFHQIDKSLSRNAEGSGIGLYLVKSLVELQGGKISVESKPDEGSIFKIELKACTIENPKVIEESKHINSKIEMINIEFSDIYSA